VKRVAVAPAAKRIAFVLLAPAALAEIGSGSTAVAKLLDPGVDLFLILAYGFPLVAIDNARTRWRLSNHAVFVLGLAYGILNEGLLAQTLVRFDDLPIREFDRYLLVGGLNLSWAALIVPWHALFSVMFPLALADAWFPVDDAEPLISQRAFAGLGVVLAAIIALLGVVRAPHAAMAFCALAIGVFTLFAFALRVGEAPAAVTESRRAGQFAFGLIGYPSIVIPTVALAHAKADSVLYFAWIAAAGAALFGFGRALGVRTPLRAPRLAEGAYASLGLSHLVFGGLVKNSFIESLAGLVFAAFFVATAFAPAAMRRI